MFRERTNFKTHFAGISLILLALSSLFLLSALPSSSVKPVVLPFLNKSLASSHLVFAGFPGCGDICPTNMLVLKQVAEHFVATNQFDSPDITFVNVELDMPHEISEMYAKSWHESIYGYSITSREADSIYSEIALRSFNETQDQKFHSGRIYLFQHVKGYWNINRVYQKTPSSSTIIRDVVALTKSKSKGNNL